MGASRETLESGRFDLCLSGAKRGTTATERLHRRHRTELNLRLIESYLNGESVRSPAKALDVTHTLLMLWVECA
jgi:transposase-like protein